MALTVKNRHVGNVEVLDLSGRITLGESAGALRDELRSLLAQGHKSILLNLGSVSYIDSAGLGELVGAYTTATNQGATVKLLNVQGKMKDLLQITKLHTVFPAFDDEKTAIASFGEAVQA